MKLYSCYKFPEDVSARTQRWRRHREGGGVGVEGGFYKVAADIAILFKGLSLSLAASN